MASGDTLVVFIPQASEPPASNYGTLDTVGTVFPHSVVDLAVGESIVFSAFMPGHYANTTGITITSIYAMTSGNADEIELETAIERLQDGVGDLATAGFATANTTGEVTVLGTAGLVDYVDSTHTKGAEMDSLVANEAFRLKVTRASAASDAPGDLELRMVIVKET